MKIRRVSCDQFAGIRDRSVSFTDGLNIIYGKNESGKSTLVNLISRILFQDAKLNGTRHKEFMSLYFPSEKKGSTSSLDSIDGKLSLENESGTYILSKEWGESYSCALLTPDGKIKNPDAINALLGDILRYGEGVYSELLFSSQRNTALSLENVLDAATATDGKKELTEVLSQAFAESDGVSLEAIAQEIETRISALAGQHWDADRDLPVAKKGGGEWSVAEKDPSKDILLKAYYALKRAKEASEKLSRLESEAADAEKFYADVEAALHSAKAAYTGFSTFAGRLDVLKERQNHIQRLEDDLEKYRGVLEKWPALTAALEKARLLLQEQTDRANLELWEAVHRILDEISGDDRADAALARPENEEISAITGAQRRIAALENQLCGMNLTAATKMLGGHTLEIISLRTGETVEVTDGQTAITEAVMLRIDGVMEMQLAPANVDVTLIEREIAEKQQEIAAIFEKYGVASLEALEKYAQRIDAAHSKIESAHLQMNRLLNGQTLEALEAKCLQANPATRSSEEIRREIGALCHGTEISRFITQTEVTLENYAAEFISSGDLSHKVDALTTELNTARASLAETDDIPEEYRAIPDIEAHLAQLGKKLDTQQELQQTTLKAKLDAESTLDAFREANPEAGSEAVSKATQEFEEKNALLKHWLHIQQVFLAEKEALASSPMEDIARSFLSYLGQISGGRISSEFPDMEKLSMNIYSNDILLDFAKLSEGTRDTVSLAFRLAVLDHLFPDGGGVIVLDDPFTDMDKDRTRQACALVQSCAQRHQVIFLTCKEELCSLLSGNRIDF